MKAICCVCLSIKFFSLYFQELSEPLFHSTSDLLYAPRKLVKLCHKRLVSLKIHKTWREREYSTTIILFKHTIWLNRTTIHIYYYVFLFASVNLSPVAENLHLMQPVCGPCGLVLFPFLRRCGCVWNQYGTHVACMPFSFFCMLLTRCRQRALILWSACQRSTEGPYRTIEGRARGGAQLQPLCQIVSQPLVQEQCGLSSLWTNSRADTPLHLHPLPILPFITSSLAKIASVGGKKQGGVDF